MAKRGKSKTLNQALDQEHRILQYYRNTGRESTANRILEGTRSVGGVVGNMADRVAMRGYAIDSPEGMKQKVSFKDRTTKVTNAEYNAAMQRNKEKAIARERAEKRAAYRKQRRAMGLSAG